MGGARFTVAWGAAAAALIAAGVGFCRGDEPPHSAVFAPPPLAPNLLPLDAAPQQALRPLTPAEPAYELRPLPAVADDDPQILRVSASEVFAFETLTHAPAPLGEPVYTPPPDVPRLDDAIAAQLPNTLPIDLGTALAITGGQNPRVAFARQRVNEAYARLRQADVLWLPSLRAGFNYNKHEGNIQDVAGEMIDTSRGSIYTGLGAQAVGAGSPAVPGLVMNFHLRDAIFNPRIAERTLAAERRASQAETNNVLLETALTYLDLLEAMQTKAVADDTLGRARQLTETTAAFARAGQGLEADADRSRTELAVREVEAIRTVETMRVASARLARLLSRDQTFTLVPEEPKLTPIEMTDVTPGLSELTALGLSNRPELAESQFLVAAAVERWRREKCAPFIPSVFVGASYGGNGGGLGGDINRFDDRFDADVAAYWEIRNLGFGEQAYRAGAQAQTQQASWRRVQMLDQVAAEVAEAFAQVESRRDQLAAAERGIGTAEDSFRRNTERIRNGQGLPIETLQSIQALDQARRLYVRTVADYNRAQFRLHWALGWPVSSYGVSQAVAP
jgi:outer membrane protein TolC